MDALRIREAMAIIFGFTKIHQFLLDRKFTLLTDHKPLVAVVSPNEQLPVMISKKLLRHAVTSMTYQFDVKYQPARDLSKADDLSWVNITNEFRFW